MSRRIRKSPSLLAPAGEFIRRLSNAQARSRRRAVRYGLWALAAFLCYSFMSGSYGLPRIIRLEMEQRAVKRANRELLMEIIDADRMRDMLRYNRQYIEQIARTRYHMARPGETVYRYHGQ